VDGSEVALFRIHPCESFRGKGVASSNDFSLKVGQVRAERSPLCYINILKAGSWPQHCGLFKFNHINLARAIEVVYL
jgi:hypothetical protein